MTDTRVMVIKPETGLIGGYAVVWGAPVNGASLSGKPVKFCCLKSAAYRWAEGDLPLLADHDFREDVGEIFGRSIVSTSAGLWAFAVLRDPVLMLKASLGQLYYSPTIVSNSGSTIKAGNIVEISLTDSPGLPPSPRHAAQNAATNARIDAIREALDTLPPDADEESVLTELERFLGPQSNEAWAELRRAGAA